MNCNIIVHINDGSKIIVPVNYEKEYELWSNIIGIGTNGLLQKEKLEYYPPHRIDKIDVEKLNT